MASVAPPRLPVLALLAAALIAGLAIAGYLVMHHENHVYGDATLTLANCPETETVNCDLVNSSAWSEVAGVPIAALAIPTYLLLLGLIACASRSPQAVAYAFCIGLLAVVYSAVLFYVSKTQVGFLCLWCMRLYAVNLSIPVLAAIAARRSPADLLRSTVRDLRAWPVPLRRAAAAFVALLALTVAGERLLRSHVRAEAVEERERIEREGGPTVPAVPPATPSGESSSSGFRLIPEAVAAEAAPPAPYTLAGPLRRVSYGKDGVVAAPFDLQARLGKGKPVALIFWVPRFRLAERTLVSMASLFAKTMPQYEVYAVSGRREDMVDGEFLEAASLLGLPSTSPLLVDDGFAVSKALTVEDVPNVVLFSAKGQLVVAKIKDAKQMLITSAGNRTASDVMMDVAKGVEVPQIQRMFPYYPSDDFLEACAPPFRGKRFGTNTPFEYAGKSTRPTLVMFWSSTCKHCQIDIPKMVSWAKKHPGQVDIVGVTAIKKDKAGEPSHRAITDAYIKTQGIPWTIVEDVEGVISRQYVNTSTPTTFFVSPSGTVKDIWYYAHEEGFDEAIERSIAKAKADGGSACRPVTLPPPSRLATSVMGADGKRVELTTLMDKPTIVHFWATWCRPCVEELPSLMRFRDTLEKSGAARVVLVSTESEADGKRILEFQKSLGLDLRSYRAPKGGFADGVDPAYRLPRTFLLAPGGAVVEEKLGRQDWADTSITEGVSARLAAAGAPPR